MPAPQDAVYSRIDLDTAQADPDAFRASFAVARAPAAPGCYLMLDAKGKPIYVGKAKNLRARLRGYLNETDSRYSVKFLMRRVARIDFLVTANEKEALLLENSLIKQHKPRYNVRLKDDKTFLSIRFDLREDFPRLTTVRRFQRDGARYFGPYDDAGAVWHTLRQIGRVFPLRTCSDHVMRNRTRPCLYYQMKRCTAPCVGLIAPEAYRAVAQQAALALEGRTAELEQDLLGRIAAHAAALEFEQAAALRDRLYALRRMTDRQRAVNVPGAADRDVFGFHNEGALTELQAIYYRGGKMLGGKSWSFKHREMPLDELVASAVLQYYAEGRVVPREVLVPVEIEDAAALAELLSEQAGHKVELHCPQRGEKRAMIDLANRNAAASFAEKRLREAARLDALEQLQQALRLEALPRRIECFDISTLQGAKTVASMAVFEDGQPAKARYRRYAMRSVEGQDDFASLREALLRRFTRAVEEGDLPDLLVIDGGKGQLGVASAVLKDLGIEDLPHCSIAKARAEAGAHSPERFFVPGRSNPIVLEQRSGAVRLMAALRDEAHRFAIALHRKRRDKATLRSALTGIPGVGPARARLLLNQLGSVARIRETPVETIAALPGIGAALARTIHAHLQSGGGPAAAPAPQADNPEPDPPA